ncbi:chemotaxis protein CheW [Hephaestia sp. GCM10023244]|uniref:chemotaxis protein CheW n=1 Tax=unclassified Hephaestia TaxID=2631281 RepID=UPI00207719B6|nr:chemotaxis protein CheW [Hephaestia sp. MAHUQ-44]MCM8730102.1 chemotaxis protein CheW [Hephaestia sp. MAHUQ-44]
MNGLFLIAEIGGRAVAIGADQVESVVDIGIVTPVPRADARVRGLAALRSRVVTVINSCVALGLPCPGDAARRAVITHIDGHPYAMLVEGVEDVAVYDLQPLTGGIALEAGWRSIATGLIEVQGEPVLAIDLRALVPGLAAAA